MSEDNTEETNMEQRTRLDDLEPKQKFEGKVVQIELYGAFVDFGAEKDGLIHISQINESPVNKVTDFVNKGDTVTVWVKKVDPEQGRIMLTMIEPPEHTIADLKPDMVLTGTVTKLVPYGAFVDIGVERDGLVHISEMAEGRIGRPSDVVHQGDEIQVKVVQVNRRKRQIELSMRGLSDEKEEARDPEDEIEPMTAMELAWRDAMERQGHPLEVPTRHGGRRRRKEEIRRRQAEIIARTLNSRKD
jgi:small subunit ribosomal protein S1